MLLHIKDLLEFKFSTKANISSSLMFNDESVSSVFKQKLGRMLEFCHGNHRFAKI